MSKKWFSRPVLKRTAILLALIGLMYALTQYTRSRDMWDWRLHLTLLILSVLMLVFHLVRTWKD